MLRSVSVTLGGEKYQVPHLNLDQIEQMIGASGKRWVFEVLRIALARATPKIENVGLIEATPDEMHQAAIEILTQSGLKKQETDDPNRPAPAVEKG